MMTTIRLFDHHTLTVSYNTAILSVSLYDKNTNETYVFLQQDKPSPALYTRFLTEKLEFACGDTLGRWYRVGIDPFWFNKKIPSHDGEKIQDEIKSDSVVENTFSRDEIKSSMIDKNINHVTYQVKSSKDADDDYLKSWNALKLLCHSLKDYPESFKSLGDVFWKQFFTDNHVQMNATRHGINDKEEFRIQNILKYFQQLQSCKQCGKQAATHGRLCLVCKHHSDMCEEEITLCHTKFDFDKVIKVMSDDMIIQLITSCGTIPLTIGQFKKHNTITGACKMIINHHAVTLYQKKRLFDVLFTNDDDMAHFLGQHFGVTML